MILHDAVQEAEGGLADSAEVGESCRALRAGVSLCHAAHATMRAEVSMTFTVRAIYSRVHSSRTSIIRPNPDAPHRGHLHA